MTVRSASVVRAALAGAVVCAIALAVTGPALAGSPEDVGDAAVPPDEACSSAGPFEALLGEAACTLASVGDGAPPDPPRILAPDSILDPDSSDFPDLPDPRDDPDAEDEPDPEDEPDGDTDPSEDEPDDETGADDETGSNGSDSNGSDSNGSDSNGSGTDGGSDSAGSSSDEAGTAGGTDSDDSEPGPGAMAAAGPAPRAATAARESAVAPGDSGAGAAVGSAVLPGVGDAVDGGAAPGLDWTGALAAPPVPDRGPALDEQAVRAEPPAPRAAPLVAAAPEEQSLRPDAVAHVGGSTLAIIFAEALPSPGGAGWDLGSVLPSLVLTLVLLAGLALPAGMVNRAAADHADRVDALLARLRAPPAAVEGGAAGPLVAAVAVTAVAGAVMVGFLSPAFPFDRSAPALVVGLVIAFVVVTLAQQGSQLLYVGRWWGVRCHVAPFPGFLLLAAIGMVLSRAMGLEPGFVVGTLAAFGALRPLRDDEAGPAIALAAASLTAVGALAWVLRDPLVAAAGAPGEFLPAALGTALTATTVAAAANLVFALVPISFLPGAALLRWSPATWAVFACVGGFAFVHLVARPAAGALADRAGLLAVLLGMHLLAAAALWAWLRHGLGLTAAHLSPAPRR